MNWEKRKTQQAYLDGELSITESIQFEDQLTSEERQRAEAEKALESALSEHIGKGGGCPDALWQSIKGQIGNQSKGSPKFFSMPRIALMATLAAVVLLAVWLKQNPTPGTQVEAKNILNIEQKLQQYLTKVQFRGSDVIPALYQQGFKGLKIETKDKAFPGSHPVRFLGMRWRIINIKGEEKRVAELMFDCCDKPVAIILIKKCEASPDCIQLKQCKKWFQASRDLGKYWAVALSYHSPQDVLPRVHEEDI